MENDGLNISKFLAQKPFSGLLLSFSNLKGTKPKQSATFEVSSGGRIVRQVDDVMSYKYYYCAT